MFILSFKRIIHQVILFSNIYLHFGKYFFILNSTANTPPHPTLDLGNIEKNKGELYRYKAYVTAANSLKAHPHKITSGKEAKSKGE